jgi:hypothetical protein
VAAALALTLSTTASASAATTAPKAGPVQTLASPDQVIACYFQWVKPFFLTTKSRYMQAQGKITACTKPPPAACKMVVELFSVSDILREDQSLGSLQEAHSERQALPLPRHP